MSLTSRAGQAGRWPSQKSGAAAAERGEGVKPRSVVVAVVAGPAGPGALALPLFPKLASNGFQKVEVPNKVQSASRKK